MKKPIALATTVAALLFAVPAPLLQTQAPSDKATAGSRRSPGEEFEGKKLTMTGRLSADGKTFVSDQGDRSWIVLNPHTTSDYAGRRVTITAVENSPRDELRVTSVHEEGRPESAR